MPKGRKKVLTPLQLSHQKFLKKMGVTKQQLKDRKIKRQEDEGPSRFRPDTLDSIRSAYD